jgi:hypothetical protein
MACHDGHLPATKTAAEQAAAGGDSERQVGWRRQGLAQFKEVPRHSGLAPAHEATQSCALDAPPCPGPPLSAPPPPGAAPPRRRALPRQNWE